MRGPFFVHYAKAGCKRGQGKRKSGESGRKRTYESRTGKKKARVTGGGGYNKTLKEKTRGGGKWCPKTNSMTRKKQVALDRREQRESVPSWGDRKFQRKREWKRKTKKGTNRGDQEKKKEL